MLNPKAPRDCARMSVYFRTLATPTWNSTLYLGGRGGVKEEVGILYMSVFFTLTGPYDHPRA